jgi:16S rRNA processing protein RimM
LKLLNSFSLKLIEIGKIVRSQGLAGQVKVLSYLQSPLEWKAIPGLFVGSGISDAVFYPVLDVRNGKGFFILKLEGLKDRDDADDLKGRFVWIQADSLKKPGETELDLHQDEYYWHDIIGLKVITEDGETLGYIEAVFPTGGNDVYVCKKDNREILLPAIEQVVKKIDTAGGVMVVRLMEGLFDS